MINGWIKLHRQIAKHWIWQDANYLKWWLDILMSVNHSPAKCLIKGKVINCGIGESLHSLETWAERWKTNKTKARRFLKLLEKDEMICLKSETVTTRLTVCKYEDYQVERNDNETQVKRKRNASETQVKPIEEEREEKNDKNIPSEEDFIKYCFDKKPNLDIESVRMKYQSWVSNGWKDGNNNEVKNWKSKMLNVIPHLKTITRQQDNYVDHVLKQINK